MPEQAKLAIAGVQGCGCITYANSRSDELNQNDRRAIQQIIETGGSIRRATPDELRADPNFLPVRCPHDPQGWKVGDDA
jgi:hypothetical protein